MTISLSLQFLFWLLFAYFLYIYAGFPLILAIWARFSGSRPQADDTHKPSVALLISAYNEAKVIGQKLENAVALDYPKENLQICLISDGSTDGTEAIAREMAEQGVQTFHYSERNGKDAALNRTIPQLTSDILIFSDANTFYEPDAISKLVRNFADPNVGCVIGRLNFLCEDERLVDGGVYWKLENRLKHWQSALRSVLVANGSIFAVPREICPVLEPDVNNDFQIPMVLGAKGYDIIYEPSAVAVEKSATNQAEEFKRKIRIVVQGLTGAAKFGRLTRGRRRFFFVSHKLLRWFGGYAQLALFVVNLALITHHWIYAGIFAAQLLFYLLALVGWTMQRAEHIPRIFNVPFYFCMVNLAAMIASWKVLRGHHISMWEKAESAR